MLDKSIPPPTPPPFFSFNIHVRHSKEQLQDFWQITIIKQSLIEQNAIFALSWKQAKYLFCFLRAFRALSEPTIIYVFLKVFSHFFSAITNFHRSIGIASGWEMVFSDTLPRNEYVAVEILKSRL